MAATMSGSADIAYAPDWLLAAVPKRRERSARAGVAVVELDTDWAVERAIKYLTTEAEIAVEGSAGDPATNRVVNRVGDFGISASLCLDLMQEHWDPRCSPPWNDGLKLKVISAYNTRGNPIGCAHPEAKAREFEKVEATPSDEPAEMFRDASRWIGTKPTREPHIIPFLLPRAYVSMIVAAGGRGKSTLAMQMMAAVVANKEFMGFQTEETGAVVGMFCEDTENTLHRRFRAICDRLSIDFESIAKNVYLESFIRRDTELWRAKAVTPLFERLREVLTKIGNVKLVVIDGAADTFAGNEIDRAEVTAFMRKLTDLAAERGVSILLSAHESKSNADDDLHAGSGSTAWLNKSRSFMKLGRPDDTKTQKLIQIRGSADATFETISCRRSGDAFDYCGVASTRERECATWAEGVLRLAIADGERLSPKRKANNYVCRWLLDQAPVGAYTIEDIEAAYGQFLHGRVFAVTEVVDAARRRIECIGLKE
jgi:hypothetical protein